MQNLPIMTVLHGEADLSKPAQDLLLLQIVHATIPRLLNLFLQVAAVSIVHNYAKLTLFGFVDFFEADDVRVLEHFEDFRLLYCILLLLLRHALYVDFLNDGVGLRE